MANSAWTDNGDAMTRCGLIGIINDRSSEIRRIDEDIERLQQAIQDIDRAVENFDISINDMKVLEAEVILVFKGESAEAFIRKMQSYRSYCERRVEQMLNLKANYSQQIKDLNYQKVVAQRVIDNINERLERIRRIDVAIFK